MGSNFLMTARIVARRKTHFSFSSLLHRTSLVTHTLSFTFLLLLFLPTSVLCMYGPGDAKAVFFLISLLFGVAGTEGGEKEREEIAFPF